MAEVSVNTKRQQSFYDITTTRQKHRQLVQIFPMPKLRYFFPQSRPLQPSSSLLQRPNRKHLSKECLHLTETSFKNMDVFIIEYIKEKTLFQNVAILEFESICIPSVELTTTKLVNWIGKHEPILVSITFNLLDKPIFLRVKDPQFLIQLLAEKNKGEMPSKILEIENIIKKRLFMFF